MTTIEREILEEKEEIRELEEKIKSFENDKSPKDETSRNLEAALQNRLARKQRLEAQASAPAPQAQGK